jgi:hypothetical protein
LTSTTGKRRGRIMMIKEAPQRAFVNEAMPAQRLAGRHHDDGGNSPQGAGVYLAKKSLRAWRGSRRDNAPSA